MVVRHKILGVRIIKILVILRMSWFVDTFFLCVEFGRIKFGKLQVWLLQTLAYYVTKSTGTKGSKKGFLFSKGDLIRGL